MALKYDKKAVVQVPDLNEIMKLIPQATEALPGIENLSSQVNQFQQGQRLDMLETAVPGLVGSFGKAGEQISQMVAGSVPKDVQDFLQNNAAAAAMGAGVSGSGYQANQFARSLGLTSLDLIQKGIGQLIGMTPVVSGAMTVNPMDLEQNIPNMTDIFNAQMTQEVGRANEVNTVRALNEAKKGVSTGSNVGGNNSANNPHWLRTTGYYSTLPPSLSLTGWR